MTETDLLISINRKLQVIVNVLLQQPLREGRARTLRDQIKLLHDSGLKPNEIARMLGKTDSYINKELTGLRKREKSTAKTKR